MNETSIVALRKRLAEEKRMRREEKINAIRSLILKGFGCKEIGDIVGVSEAIVVNYAKKINEEEPKKSWGQ